MSSPAQDSDAILSAARRSLVDQRAGGRRVPRGRPIGQRSAALRRGGLKRKLAMLGLGLVAAGIPVVMLIFTLLSLLFGGLAVLLKGLLVGGLAFAGLVWLIKRISASTALMVPTREALSKGSAAGLIGNVELWLEAQRPQLPAPALDLVGQLGGKLDLLATQLDRLGEDAPAVAQVRALVGEHLPEVVSAYTAIPAPLRGQKQGGSTPDEQLAQSLTRIGGEIDSVTAQLAEGAIDRLAIQTRFLDMKYGEGGVDQKG